MSGKNHLQIYSAVKDHLIDHIARWNTHFDEIKGFLEDAYDRMFQCDLDGEGSVYTVACTPDMTVSEPWNEEDTLWGYCNKYTDELEGWIKECDRKQSISEMDYCEWRNARNSMCNHREDCVFNKTRDHNALIATIKPVADRRTHEGALLNYIVCLVGLLKEGVAEQVNITACGNKEGSTYTDTLAQTDFNVTYPALDGEDPCDRTPVEKVPATSSFYEAKYKCDSCAGSDPDTDFNFPEEAPAYDDSLYDETRCENAPSNTHYSVFPTPSPTPAPSP